MPPTLRSTSLAHRFSTHGVTLLPPSRDCADSSTPSASLTRHMPVLCKEGFALYSRWKAYRKICMVARRYLCLLASDGDPRISCLAGQTRLPSLLLVHRPIIPSFPIGPIATRTRGGITTLLAPSVGSGTDKHIHNSCSPPLRVCLRVRYGRGGATNEATRQAGERKALPGQANTVETPSEAYTSNRAFAGISLPPATPIARASRHQDTRTPSGRALACT